MANSSNNDDEFVDKMINDGNRSHASARRSMSFAKNVDNSIVTGLPLSHLDASDRWRSLLPSTERQSPPVGRPVVVCACYSSDADLNCCRFSSPILKDPDFTKVHHSAGSDEPTYKCSRCQKGLHEQCARSYQVDDTNGKRIAVLCNNCTHYRVSYPGTWIVRDRDEVDEGKLIE